MKNVTNTSLYTLPAAVSLSRITYQTVTLNGTSIPASAYILWPYLPRTFRNITGHPVIGWAHGTSGVLPECAPSHIRNLWYQYSGPYIMALLGYVVVAPDYAGLGVGNASPSSGAPPILHPYLSSASHAHDLVHAIAAAQSAFPSLSASFVTIGHSQGGGTTWALTTTTNTTPPNRNHLGAVAASPPPAGPSFLALLAAAARSNTALGPYLAAGLAAAFGAPQSELFTPAGQARWGLLAALGGCSSVAAELFAPAAASTTAGWVHANISAHWAARALAAASDYARRQPSTPLLVMQGLADRFMLAEWTEASVNRTCELFPQSAVEYVGFEGVTHVPVMYAGQRVWLDWVAERFEGRAVEAGCSRRRVRGAREEEGAYLAEFNYFLEPVTAGYQVA